MNNRLLPLERTGLFVIRLNELVDRLAQLLGRGETRTSERLSDQDAEPALDLVQERKNVLEAITRLRHQPTAELNDTPALPLVSPIRLSAASGARSLAAV